MNRYQADSPCPKCGSTHALVQWHSGNSAPEGATLNGQEIPPGELMDRMCDRCSFRWLELPLDGR